MPQQVVPCIVCHKPTGWKQYADPLTYMCHPCRRARRARRASMRSSCADCGKPITGKSQRCRSCAQKHRNRKSVEKQARSCAWCGSTFRTRETRPGQAKYCQHSCYAAAKRGYDDIHEWASLIPWKTCPECSNPFIPKYGRTYCGAPCRYARRLRQLNSWYWYSRAIDSTPEAKEWRQALIWWLRQRDGDLCNICQDTHGPIQWDMPSGPHGDPSGLGPSIDHIHPVSLGGTDDVDNLALTHWACNRARRANPLPTAQLALI